MRKTVAKRIRKEAARISKPTEYFMDGGTLKTSGFKHVYREMKRTYLRGDKNVSI